MKTASRYTPIHAAAAAVLLIAAVARNFWHNFLHGGFASPPAVPVVLFVLGCVLFITQWKKVRLLPAERELQRKEKDASWQNGGVILFCVLGSISILLTLMMGIGF